MLYSIKQILKLVNTKFGIKGNAKNIKPEKEMVRYIINPCWQIVFSKFGIRKCCTELGESATYNKERYRNDAKVISRKDEYTLVLRNSQGLFDLRRYDKNGKKLQDKIMEVRKYTNSRGSFIHVYDQKVYLHKLPTIEEAFCDIL